MLNIKFANGDGLIGTFFLVDIKGRMWYIDVGFVRAYRKNRGEERLIMPRRARRDLESSYLHVIVQGIEKKYISLKM